MKIPICKRDNNISCFIHKDNKYLKWTCGTIEDSLLQKANRRDVNLKRRIQCACGNFITQYSSMCKKCSSKISGEKRKGVPLSDEWRKNIGNSHRGEKSVSWKGDTVDYSALHYWVRRNLGKATKCSSCNVLGFKNKRAWSIEWANIDGSYKRDLNHWVPLCRKCHVKKDTLLRKQNKMKTVYINNQVHLMKPLVGET